jgi:hypothetical protein
MKINKIFNYIFILGAIALAFTSCDPQVVDGPQLGPKPSADQLSFSIAQGADDFHPVITNTSAITGIAKWDFGNGNKGSGESVTPYYPLSGKYTVTLTLYTSGGSASVTKEYTQDATDYSYFQDPAIIALSGGVDNLNGKTWVVDSLAQGHYGVGPAGSDGTAWWSAAPLDKKGFGAYDDELNFKLNGFVVTYTNHGKSFVKSYQSGVSFYSNPVDAGGDLTVDYTPEPGSWSISTENGKQYLILSGPTPIFPTFDVGAVDGKYEILNISENKLELVATGGDGNAWHYLLIPKGYVKPTVKWDLNVATGADANTFDISLANVQVPSGISISQVTYDFGDGTDPVTVSDYQQAVTHVYMRQGTYQVTATLEANEEQVKTASVVVDQNSPDYVPFQPNVMVMYNDFSEVQMEPVLGQDCAVDVVANPSKIYPNKSAYVAHYSKSNQQWANAYLQLPAGYRFDLRTVHTFSLMVYGKAGDVVLLKLENTDLGGNAWTTGVEAPTYTIQNDNTWEKVTFEFAGAGTAQGQTGDVTTDPTYSNDYYNVVRIMLNPGNGSGDFDFYFDELQGPSVEGIKSAQF